MLNGRVLITGGSGFLGRGIMRRAKREAWPCEFTVYSRDEFKQALCKKLYPEAKYVLGDIQNTDRLYVAMLGHDVVVHAAAIKYVPESEHNAFEAVDVNINGTISVIQAATRAQIKQVIGISTDKAVRPINVYGMTKAVCERLLSEASDKRGPIFKCVRYGNVVGSTGSVIPVFKDQFMLNGSVNVTDPNMTRFWMSVDQAIDVILNAYHQAMPGMVVIPRPQAMSIGELASCIAGKHINIIGIRPGEKMHEELLHYEESLRLATFINGSKFYGLLPAGTAKQDEQPFTVSSQQPPAGWVTQDQMLSWMADSLAV